MSTEIIADVPITLDGESVRLKICQRAAKEITAAFGNYLEPLRKLAEFDYGAYVVIVAAGLGKKRSEVEEAVYKTGLPNLTGDLSDYIGLLTRGGRPEKTEGGDKTGEA